MKNQEVKKSIETKENESGRSMVEMLGVLAIMGVLAIGGIAGYRWAMDKYNANEILNEVRKRAVTASQQRILGHAINLSEYGDNTIQGHRVTSADNYKGDSNFFTITVEGIEQNICEKVLAETIPFAIDTWVGENSDACAKGNSNTITFAFANTLDRGATPSEPKPTIPAGKECTNGCTEPATCVNGYCQCPNNQIWNPSGAAGAGKCVEVTDGNCTKNADCEKVEDCKNGKCYCAISSSAWDCTKADTGTCTPLDEGNPAGTYNGHTFLRSGSPMNWWSARNWCLAHDMKLTSLSDLGITGGYESGLCGTWTTDCQFKAGLSWSGLQEALGSGYSDWTDDSLNSCDSFGVPLRYDYVTYSARYNRSSALCAKES